MVPVSSVVPSASSQTTPMLGTSVAVAPTSQLVATQPTPQPGQVKRKCFSKICRVGEVDRWNRRNVYAALKHVKTFADNCDPSSCCSLP